jgi:hypothetical protein
MRQDDGMADPPPDRGARPEDRPIDPEAVRRLEQIPDPTTDEPAAGSSVPPRLARPVPTRNTLVTTAGVVLVVVGAFVAIASVLAIAPSDGLELLGVDLDGGSAATVFLVLAAVYAITGILVLTRRPIGRPLGVLVGVLALVSGLAQLPATGVSGIPTVGVAAFVLYALGIGGNDFRRR